MTRMLAVLAVLPVVGGCVETPPPSIAGMPRAIVHHETDTQIRQWMTEDGEEGLAYAVIDEGQVRHVRAFGKRNAAGEPLETDTVMYGASLTKAMVGYIAADLAAENRLDLDRSIAEYLPKPLPQYTGFDDAYAPWQDLAGDDRWRAITPRIVLNHSAGFANFHWLEPDGKLKMHFAPGERYAYSGDGFMLLQFVLVHGLGLDLQAEAKRRVFDRFGMTRSSLIWRDDFRPNLADGWKADGTTEPHDERSRVRAAGSLDTTIADMARFVAGVMRGPSRQRDELFSPQLPIRSASQFPSLLPEATPERQIAGLAAGLGTVTFTGSQGRGFFKGGHNDSTGNMLICLETGNRCLLLLGNDVRAERLYPRITQRVLGETGMPWRWEYGDADWVPR